MPELDELPISIVIPTYNDIKSFENVLDAIYSQSVRPKQIVIIDSSETNDIEITLQKYSNTIEILYKKVERSFPGRARNLGARIASEKYLAFLDSKTIPNRNWLSSSFALLRDYDVVLGSVHYRGLTTFKRLISIASYGEKNLEHISGTLLLKSVFLKIGFFNEKYRAGEDVDWKDRLKESEFNYFTPIETRAEYSEIPGNLIFHMKRAFIYQMQCAFLDIQLSTRVVFFSLFIILLATLIPSWNVGHTSTSLFIPHITKFFLLFLGLFIFVSFICLKIFVVGIKVRRALMYSINLSLLIWFFVVVDNWNAAIPVWDQSSPFFIPHITKLYLVSLLLLSFIVRGIIFPIKRGVDIKYLFPYRFVVIGLIGLILDVSKSPGYFMGSLIALSRKVTFMFKDIRQIDTNNASNIDKKTVSSFGNEWTRFNQKGMLEEESMRIFDNYFSLFPWNKITSDSEGFDMGCGSGRWARYAASRVGHLNCIDPSSAIDVAKKTLNDCKNVTLIRGSVSDSQLKKNSQDFGYSLGVLHHVPDTQKAINSCVELLKVDAPLLLYLYYAFDNKPFFYKFIWRVSDIIRSVISKLPISIRNIFTDLIFLFVYVPFFFVSKTAERLGINPENIPLSYYRNHSFYTMRTDSRDRFGTPLEQRFTRAKIKAMMIESGLKDIQFSDNEPFWCVIGYKK